MKKFAYIFILGLAFTATSNAQEKTKAIATAKEIATQDNDTKDLQTIASSISDLTEEQKTIFTKLLANRSNALNQATTKEQKTQLKQDFGAKILGVLTVKQRAEFEKNEAAYKKLIKGL